MGFGFVLAHFGIFPDEHSSIRYGSGLEPHELSGWLGAALIAVGVTVNLYSAWRYMRHVGELNRGQFVQRSISKHGVTVAMFLALLGIAITIYIVLVLPDPANLLRA
jgi:putative membrane protein